MHAERVCALVSSLGNVRLQVEVTSFRGDLPHSSLEVSEGAVFSSGGEIFLQGLADGDGVRPLELCELVQGVRGALRGRRLPLREEGPVVVASVIFSVGGSRARGTARLWTRGCVQRLQCCRPGVPGRPLFSVCAYWGPIVCDGCRVEDTLMAVFHAHDVLGGRGDDGLAVVAV